MTRKYHGKDEYAVEADSPAQARRNNGAQNTDLEIIKLLQQDGRMSYASIAKSLQMSEGAVRKRVLQLMEDQVISIVAEADPAAFGYNLAVIVLIEPAPGADIDRLANYFSALPEVTYVVRLASEVSLAIDTYANDLEELNDFLNKHINSNADILKGRPMIKMKAYKMRPKWNELLNTTPEQQTNN